MRPLQPALIKRIKKLRTQNFSLEKIAELLNIDRESATKYSKDIELSNNDKYEIRSRSLRKYDYNISALTKENAVSYYLLGAFITDGHIEHDSIKHKYIASIVSNDFAWLQDIRNIVCPNKPIFKSSSSNAHYVRFSNKYITDWFISKGCLPRKSLTVKFPSVPKKYLPDFIRGCFDGDGCLCIYKSKREKNQGIYSYISSASKSFIADFAKVLKKFNIRTTINKVKLCNSVIDGRKIIARHNLYRLHLSKVSTYKLCQLIYYRNCLCLERKHTKAKNIIKMCDNNYTIPFIKELSKAA